jgi:hypothetical protein
MDEISRICSDVQQSVEMRNMMQMLTEHNPVKKSEVEFYMPMRNKRMCVCVLTDGISAMVFEETEYGWYGTGKPFTGTLEEVAAHCHQVIEGYKFLYNV